jgi:DNA-binding IclR family transcriptional regulator
MKPRSTTRNASTSGTQAVERALAILHAVGDMRDEPGLTELAGSLGLHKTTVFRLLGALERGGFVTRDVVGQRYRLGPTLLRLATQARRSVGLHEAARPELEALARETGETATLELLVGDQALILDEVHGRFLVGSSPEVGTRWPAHATSTGKVLLAAARFESGGTGTLPLPAGRLAKLAPRTITSRLALERELADVWLRGYSVGREEIERGFVAIGAPVRDTTGRVVAAISVGGPSTRLDAARVAQLGPRVRLGGERISLRLGAPANTSSIGMNDPPRRHRRRAAAH